MDQSGIALVLLLATRLGAAFAFGPPIGAGMTPALVRLCLVLALSVALAPLAPVRLPGVIQAGFLMAAAASEAALGATLGLGLSLGFAIFTFGARIVDIQVGFGMGQVFDPLSRQQLPVLTAAFNLLALAGFFSLGLHHGVMRGLALSIEHFPPGASWSLQLALGPVVRHAGQVFSLGFAMVAPVISCLVLVELGLAVMARNLPQINMLSLGIPIKLAVGLAMLSVWVAASSAVVTRAYASIFAVWEAILR